MDVLVPKLAGSDVFLALPFVHGGTAPLLLLPVPVDDESLMAVGLHPDPDFIIVCTVELAFWVLWVVDANDAMGVALTDQSHHAFLLEATRTVLHQIFVPKGKRVCLLELDSVGLELEVLIRTTPQFHLSSADDSILIGG